MQKIRRVASLLLLVPLATVGLLSFQRENVASQVTSQSARAQDPGVRGGVIGTGSPIAGLTAQETEYFLAGKAEFEEEETVAGGLGPRLNLDSCAGCHSQPAIGGTSPATNSPVANATQDGGTDAVPSFISADGPVREARFVQNRDGTADGGVH